MTTPASTIKSLVAAPRQIARQLPTIGGNRLELLAAEVEEGRGRLVLLMAFTMGVTVFILLAGMAFSAALIFALWAHDPLVILMTLLGMGLVYSGAALLLFLIILNRLRSWTLFPASLKEWRKDQQALAEQLS